MLYIFSLQKGPGSNKRKLNKTVVVTHLLLYLNEHGNTNYSLTQLINVLGLA